MVYPKLVTLGIIEENNKILLIKRANEPEKGKWAFPGGTGAFEKTSNPVKAVKGEVKYDLNVQFVPKKFFNIYFRGGDTPTLSLVYLGSIKGNIHTNSKSILESKFFSWKEAGDLNLAFEHNKIIEDYLASN